MIKLAPTVLESYTSMLPHSMVRLNGTSGFQGFLGVGRCLSVSVYRTPRRGYREDTSLDAEDPLNLMGPLK